MVCETNLPPPKKKTCFFPLSKRSSSIGKMVIHFSSAHLWAQPNFPDSSDALLPQQDGRQRPHDGHGEQGSQDFRLVESWKNVAPLLRRWPFQAMFGVFCEGWNFEGKESGCKTSECKVKNSRKNSIRQKPPTPKNSRLISFSNVPYIFGYLHNICSDEISGLLESIGVFLCSLHTRKLQCHQGYNEAAHVWEHVSLKGEKNKPGKSKVATILVVKNAGASFWMMINHDTFLKKWWNS